MRIGNIFVLLTILSITGIADAATITVDDSGGADYMKIQDAINAANTGDTIEVRSGIYYENVNVNKKLILQGVNTGEGRPLVVSSGGSGSSGVYIATNGVLLEGFDITRNDYLDYNFGIRIYSSNNIIKDNFITKYSWGIILTGNDNTISDNSINNNKWGGISISYSNRNTITNNIIDSNGLSACYDPEPGKGCGRGIVLSSRSDNNEIRNNIIRFNLKTGVVLNTSYDNIVKDNNIDNNVNGIAIIYGASDNVIYNNYFNNSQLYIDSMITGAGNNIFNVEKTVGTNIIGGPYIGGNFWGKLDGTGFSQTCSDIENDGICDTVYEIEPNSIDNLPLASPTPICGNTPSGQNVDVNPLSDIDMIFDNVVQCGNTLVTTYFDNQWTPLLNNYQGISFNDIQTTATYSNNVNVNITYSDSDISNIDENSIKMFHYENGNWIDITTSLDIASNKVTGTVNSLSPFAIAGISSGTPTPTVTPISAIVRGSSLDIIGIMILSICLVIVSISRMRI